MERRGATRNVAATRPESDGNGSGIKERGGDGEISTNIPSTPGVVGGKVYFLQT